VNTAVSVEVTIVDLENIILTLSSSPWQPVFVSKIKDKSSIIINLNF